MNWWSGKAESSQNDWQPGEHGRDPKFSWCSCAVCGSRVVHHRNNWILEWMRWLNLEPNSPLMFRFVFALLLGCSRYFGFWMVESRNFVLTFLVSYIFPLWSRRLFFQINAKSWFLLSRFCCSREWVQFTAVVLYRVVFVSCHYQPRFCWFASTAQCSVCWRLSAAAQEQRLYRKRRYFVNFDVLSCQSCQKRVKLFNSASIFPFVCCVENKLTSNTF